MARIGPRIPTDNLSFTLQPGQPIQTINSEQILTNTFKVRHFKCIGMSSTGFYQTAAGDDYIFTANYAGGTLNWIQTPHQDFPDIWNAIAISEDGGLVSKANPLD